MALTRIDSLDFISEIVSTSTSCWRDTNNNPINTISGGTPGASSETIYSNISNRFIGNRSNVQYSTATADKNGSNTDKSVYGKIRNIVYGDYQAEFFWGGTTRNSFAVLSVASSKFKSALLPGSLRIGTSTAYTDNSNMEPPQLFNCGRAYKLVLGSVLPGGIFSYGVGTGEYGYVFPDIGIIISSINLASNASLGITLRNEDLTPLNSVFIRTRNSEYNYSTNPSFISGSSGIIIYPEWYENPQAYITTIGLYNDNNELLATAKLPRPYNKNFNNEALFQVNLNF
jgi:hypothetical protein